MIGYYVHHHGAGHTHRFLAMRERVPGLVGLGSGPRPAGLSGDEWITLAYDAQSSEPVDPTASGALHWAPLNDPGMRARTARIAAWVGEARPRALVVDVSVEVALTARLLSVPTVVIAQHGDRSDPPHRLAYASASAVAALWPDGAAPAPPGSEGRLQHVGPISRFDGRDRSAPLPADTTERRHPGEADRSTPGDADAPRQVLLMLGRGGHELPLERVAETIAAAAAQGWAWDVLGQVPELDGRTADADEVWAALRRADVVVAPASNNCVAETAAARTPLIAVPQVRPFGEQHAHAAQLAAAGLATVLQEWPEPKAWPALLDEAAGRGGDRWADHHDGAGADRLAAVIDRVARGA